MMSQIRSRSRSSGWLLGAIVVAMVCLAVSLAVGHLFGSLALGGVAVMVVGVCASAQAARWWTGSRAVPAARRTRRILIVGAGPVAQHAAQQAELQGFQVLGFVEDLNDQTRAAWPAGVIGPRGALADLARDLAADQIIVTDAPSRVLGSLAQLEREGVPAEVFVVPDVYELALCRPSSHRIGDVALVRLPRRRASWAYSAGKRVLDVTLSVVLLALFGPVMLLAMWAIRRSDPGPSLYRQERVGKDGRRFEVIKLRTMIMDAEKEGPRLCAGGQDPRLTPVGRFLRKTHIDELPQLINVLRGEMSFVGPRPERPVFVEQFEKELPRYAERHRILPGITGLAQVNGYYHSSPREKLRYDLMYVYHPSLWLDLCIIVRTLANVFR